MAPTRILIVDNNAEYRYSLSRQLRSQPDFVVVDEVQIGLDAVLRARALLPDVILLDIEMREMDAVSSIRALKAAAPSARIIAFSIVHNSRYRKECRSAGAHTHISKDSPVDLICETIRTAEPSVESTA